jgi:hypothetical protein
VLGLANALEGAAMLAGALAAGALGDRLGIIPVIAVQGFGYCLAGALMLLRLPSRHDVGHLAIVRRRS